MRIYLIPLLGLVLLASAGAVDSVIVDFDAKGISDRAILEWTSGIEGSLALYKVERSDNGRSFISIDNVDPRGSNMEYQYIDTNPLDNGNQHIFYYRIKMVFADGSFTYSETKSATLTFSGLQETWGTIKAMFR